MQTLIGAIKVFVIRDLLIVTKKISHIGHVKIRIVFTIDSTVNMVSMGVTIRSKKAEAIISTEIHNNR
jgi:hypothetical protein